MPADEWEIVASVRAVPKVYKDVFVLKRQAMKAKEVLSLMDEIERTVYATQSWWPQLRRLIEQKDAAESTSTSSTASFSLGGCWYCGRPRGTHTLDCPEVKHNPAATRSK